MATHSTIMHNVHMGRAASSPETPPLNPEGSFFNDDAVEVLQIPGETHIAGANINYTLHVPRDPDLITDEATTVIGHGYGGIEKAYFELADHLAASGKPTATISPVRSMGWLGDLNPANYREPITLNSKAIWAVMRQIGREQGVEMFDILGHSLGGRSGTEAARAHPDYVRNLSVYGSVGVSGHKLPEMIVNLAGVALNELPGAARHLVRAHGYDVGLDFAYYALRNPARTIAEGLAAGSSEIREDIQELRAAGVKTSKVYFPADGFFHPHRVTRFAEGVFDILHRYDDAEANHVALQTDPRGVALAHAAITNELGSKRAKLSVVA